MKRRDFRERVGVKVSVDADLERRRLYVAGKTDSGREFQSLEVIGINELANAYVRLVCGDDNRILIHLFK